MPRRQHLRQDIAQDSQGDEHFMKVESEEAREKGRVLSIEGARYHH